MHEQKPAPDGDFEVQFCDLCGTSVPLSDLERGAALRHQAKTIGACCLTILRQGDSPLASPGLATNAAGRSDAGSAGRSREGGMLLPVAIALLAGMAGLAIYLDLKIQGLSDRQADQQRGVAASIAASGETLTGIDQAMDGAARQSDLDALRERFAALQGAVELGQEQSRQQQEKARLALDAVQQGVAQLEAQRVDYRPLFDDLRQQMQRATRALADLSAAATVSPSAEPAVTEPTPVEPSAVEPPAEPGLPAELATQVKRLGDGDAAVRFEAVDHLLVSKNLAVLPFLVPMTRDADGFVRRLAVEGLRDFKHPDAVEALLESLGDEDATVAETAWSSLKRLTGQKIAFDASSPSKDARTRAQQRWREWWDKNKAAFGS